MTPKPIFIRIDDVDAACIAAIRSHLGYITTLSASQTDAGPCVRIVRGADEDGGG